METACYYTFSTISQTLAGAFGFLVAVVLYRMQHLLKIRERLEEREAEQASRLASLRAGGVGAAQAERPEGHLRDTRQDIQITDDQHDKLIKDLRHSLYSTVATIGGCLVLLALTPLLAKAGPLLIGCALIGTLLAAFYTMATYAVLALRSVGA